MKKRLLILTPDFPDETNTYIGGIFIKNYVDAVKDYFHEITVISPVLFSCRVMPNDRLCKNYRYDNVEVFFPRCLFVPRCLSLPYLSNKTKLQLDNRVQVVTNLINRLGKSFDIIHTHFTWPSTYVGVALKERLNIPVIATIHEDPVWLLEEDEMDHAWIQKAWTNADALVRANTSDTCLLKKYNTDVFCIPNGYSHIFKPMDSALCRRELGLPEDKKILLSVGNLEIIKGHNHLIEAIKRVTRERKDLLCFIIGDGSQKQALERQIQEENLSDYVRMAGSKPHDRIPAWMNACDLFVLPSLNESFGIVQIEALACGKPVIATSTPGSKEIITSDKHGLLCRPGDGEDLAEKIMSGLEHEWDSRDILSYAEGYSWDKIAQEIISLYGTVLCERHGVTERMDEIGLPVGSFPSSAV
jgi:teichuronic acid biosynthesis glycosyltransferase TuaC